MADNVVIYHVFFQGAAYEANLLSGTYFKFENEDRRGARQRALTRAGIPFKDWDGTPASMDQEFGKEVVSADVLAKKAAQAILDANVGHFNVAFVLARLLLDSGVNPFEAPKQ